VVAGLEPCELQALLWSRAVPQCSKQLTCAAALFEHTRAKLHKQEEVIDYAAAVRRWSLPATPAAFNSDEYHVAVAMTLLDPCFPRTDTVDRQVRARLLAAAANNDQMPPVPDAAIFARFQRESGFRDARKASLFANNLIGQIVAVVDTAGTWNINADPASLCPSSELAAAFDWPPFVAGLYAQLRLAAEFMESTALRLSLAALGRYRAAFERLHQSNMMAEADELASIIRPRLEGRPYASCSNGLDYWMTAGHYPRLCAYARLVYAQQCNAATQAAWGRYDRSKGPYKSVPEHEFHVIKVVADETTTFSPPFSAAETAALLEQLQMEKAEEYLDRLRPDFRATVRRIILDSAVPSPIQASLKEGRDGGGGGRRRY
jgi:hypothetical protein